MSLFAKIRDVWRGRDKLPDVVGINRRNVELVYAYNKRKDYPLVDDKIVCKALMEANGVPVAPTVAVCEGLFDIPRVMNILRERDNFVIKPANGSGGDGIVVTGARTATGWLTAKGRDMSEDEAVNHFANIVFGAYSKQLDDRAFVEERIVPHPLFHEFYSGGVSDIRLIFLKGKCLISMVRIPTKMSGGRANLHQGGIGVAVDIETGMTTRAVFKGTSVVNHPETGKPLVGRQLPDWEGIHDVARRAAACVPLGYVGVDVVVDVERGPLILELNARPGLEIQNINGFPMGPIVDAALAHEV
jgi:alpha-L-glutamate ligase-like protein